MLAEQTATSCTFHALIIHQINRSKVFGAQSLVNTCICLIIEWKLCELQNLISNGLMFDAQKGYTDNTSWLPTIIQLLLLHLMITKSQNVITINCISMHKIHDLQLYFVEVHYFFAI